jgi:hypothetical protein
MVAIAHLNEAAIGELEDAGILIVVPNLQRQEILLNPPDVRILQLPALLPEQECLHAGIA